MKDSVADTHAVVWTLAEPTKLSKPATAVLRNSQSQGRILVATITLIELAYLTEKGSIDANILTALWDAIQDPAVPVEAVPLSLNVADGLLQIPWAVVPDMPDRIIAATALVCGLPLVSADSRIRSLSVPGLSVIW